MTNARIKEVTVDVLRERDGSYAIACTPLGVYAVGTTLAEARKDFLQALDLHLTVIRSQAAKVIAHAIPA